MSSALKGVDGINLDIKAGDPDFTVHYDSKKIQPAKILEAVQTARPGAKLKS